MAHRGEARRDTAQRNGAARFVKDTGHLDPLTLVEAEGPSPRGRAPPGSKSIHAAHKNSPFTRIATSAMLRSFVYGTLEPPLRRLDGARRRD